MNTPRSSKNNFVHHLHYLILIGLLIFAPVLIQGQTNPQWDRDFGGNIWEELNSVEETDDGGYILAGFSSSSQNGDFQGISNGSGDYWLIKTDSEGIIEWENNYGGDELERPWSVTQTMDGGYIVGGYSPSGISGDKSAPSRGGDDYWIVKVDAAGTIEWDSTYGGEGLDHLYSLIQTSDGGYLLGGRSLSEISGEKTEANKGSWDHWIVKTDANGTIEWDKTIGGSDEDFVNQVQEAPDGTFYIGGSTRSPMDGLDIGADLIGVKDFWFVNISAADGSIIWERRYGGTDEDEMQSFVQTQDGGFLFGGGSRSNTGFNKSDDNFGIVDMWVLKVDAAGTPEWDHTFGGDNLDNCYSVSQNSIGYYVLGGYSGSVPGSGNLSSVNKGGWDYLLVYLDNNGEYKWDQSFGGDQNDVLETVFQTSDGGYVLAGHSSTDVSGDKTQPTKGLNDFWMIKTDCSVFVDFADTIVCPNQPIELNAYTNSNCIDCTWEWSDSPSGDSIRIIEAGTTGTYTVTLVDGVGCSRTDDITISIYNTNIVDIGDDLALCDGENTVLDATVLTGVGYEWSTGETSTTITVDTAATYAVTVTDNNNCALQDSVAITVGALPIVNLGNDTIVCVGATVTLDAGNPGANYAWSPSPSSSQTIVTNLAGIYTAVVTDNGCVGSDEIEITNFDMPSLIGVDAMCNDSNTYYTVTFEIGGGDGSSYAVIGAGTLTGNTFVSTPIPKDQPYSFSFDDINACGPVLVEGTYDCECLSESGTLDTSPLVICGNEAVAVTLQNNPVVDNNDLFLFVMHDGTSTTIGNVIDSSAGPTFTFQAGMVYGTTYYITTVVGNDNGNGGIVMEDGCLSTAEGVPVTFFQPPTALITPLTSLSITCNETTLILDGAFSSAPTGTLEYSWEAIDGGSISSATDEPGIELTEAGTYILTVTNLPGGCIDTAMVTVIAADDIPIVDIQLPGEITCINETVQIDATGSSNGPDYTVVWSGGALTGSSNLTPTVTDGGTYILTITNETNGCSETASIDVIENNQPPLVSLASSVFLDCMTSEAELTLNIIPAGNYDIEWTTTNGNIVIGNDPLTPIVTESGSYFVTVTDSSNGCTFSTMTDVFQNQNMPSDILFTIMDPSCFGENDGTIEVDSVIGGTPGYVYSFDGSSFSAAGFTAGLESGDYSFAVQDDMGCVWETNVSITDPQPLVVELGDPNVELELGDSLRLQALVNQPLDTFVWTSQLPLSCYDCLTTWMTPLNETSVTIEVWNEDGCYSSDQLVIVVQKERNIYIPNSFSPNGDGVNDYFTVYGGKGVVRVRHLRVFDRWGELVFFKEELPLNFESEGWNGTFKGDIMNTGVYIYLAEVEFTDGYVQKYFGDVTIVK